MCWTRIIAKIIWWPFGFAVLQLDKLYITTLFWIKFSLTRLVPLLQFRGAWYVISCSFDSGEFLKSVTHSCNVLTTAIWAQTCCTPTTCRFDISAISFNSHCDGVCGVFFSFRGGKLTCRYIVIKFCFDVLYVTIFVQGEGPLIHTLEVICWLPITSQTLKSGSWEAISSILWKSMLNKKWVYLQTRGVVVVMYKQRKGTSPSLTLPVQVEELAPE